MSRASTAARTRTVAGPPNLPAYPVPSNGANIATQPIAKAEKKALSPVSAIPLMKEGA
ncbi:hypothetical protein ACFP81_06425 [Deinococcus lacus]|uniref:Uncharacterized protein n=1 Tax=Deinococcus lacus TaxID=392561 RepID=A0ABW1YCB1_9DEIO